MAEQSTGSLTGSARTERRAVDQQPRKAKRFQGTLYRGREGMWSWVLHRITGVAIYFFLLVHILDTALVRVSPEAYNAVIGTYKNPIMGLGETGLVAAIVLPRAQRPPHHPHRLLERRHEAPARHVLDRHRPLGRAHARLRPPPAHERLLGVER